MTDQEMIAQLKQQLRDKYSVDSNDSQQNKRID